MAYEIYAIPALMLYIALAVGLFAWKKNRFFSVGIMAQVALLPFMALFVNGAVWGSVFRTVVVELVCLSPLALMLLRYKLPHGERLEKVILVLNTIILMLAIILGLLITLFLLNVEGMTL